MTYRWDVEDLLNLQDALIVGRLYDPRLKSDRVCSLIQDIRSLLAVMDVTRQKHVYPIPQENMMYITGKDPDKL